MGKFGLKKLETSPIIWMWSVFWYLESFTHESRVWQTDRRTDGRKDSS